MKTLFLLAMRSGSKGVRDKNIRPLGGLPLFAHAARAVLGSQACREGGTLLASTDSQQYAEIANQYGAVTPFLRPGTLAGDRSPIRDVMAHAFEYFESRAETFDLFALIQATSPFITSADIDQAVALLREGPAVQSVISVTPAEVPPCWCNTLDASLSMKDFLAREIRQKNRQELPQYYRVTGAIRIARWLDFRANQFDWYMDGSKALILDRTRSLDIDSEEDFLYAEFLMQRRAAATGQGA